MPHEDVLQQMVRDSSSVVTSSVSIMAANQQKIDDLNTKIVAVKEGVCDVAANKLSDRINLLYDTTTNHSIFITGDAYNQAYDSTGTLEDWRVLTVTFDNNVLSSYHFTPLNDSTFYSLGDVEFLFTPRSGLKDIAVAKRNYFTHEIENVRSSNIVRVEYNSTYDVTYVIISDRILYTTDDILYLFIAEYNNPVDSTMTDIVTQWNYAHDLLLKPMDTSGTYGLIPMKNNLSTGNSVVGANKNKNAAMPDMLNSYAYPPTS